MKGSITNRELRNTYQKLKNRYTKVKGIFYMMQLFVQKILGSELDHHGDMFHSNAVEIMDRDIPGFCRTGDLLISVRQFDTVAIVDPEQWKVTWQWGQGELERQHHPTLTDRNTLLIFDNGMKRKYSRVVEVDPLTRRIVWEYKSSPPTAFFSQIRGGNQRLPNGNTLITESEKGHVFEVTPAGDTVWEFYNPDMSGDGQARRSIYRMRRLSDPREFPFISQFHSSGGSPL